MKGGGFENSTDWSMTSWTKVVLGSEAPFVHPNWSFFFLRWTFFKVFIEFVTILLLFYVLVF